MNVFVWTWVLCYVVRVFAECGVKKESRNNFWYPFFLCPEDLWDSKTLPCQISLSPCIFARMHTVPSAYTSFLCSMVNTMCTLSFLYENKGREPFPYPPVDLLLWNLPPIPPIPPNSFFSYYSFFQSLSMSLGIPFHFALPDPLFWCCPLL